MTKDEAIDRGELIDEQDGENRALRSFLMQYSCDRSITVGAMLAHMNRSGWRGTAPPFALEVRPETHLTKGGAQVWIRHLIGLEAPTSEAVAWPSFACASCYGSGIDVAGKPCACNCLHSMHHRNVIAAQPSADPAPVPAQGIDHAKLIEEALELAHDLAVEQQAEIAVKYEGYKPHKHAAAARDVALAKEALAAWQERGRQAGGAVGPTIAAEMKDGVIRVSCAGLKPGKNYFITETDTDAYDPPAEQSAPPVSRMGGIAIKPWRERVISTYGEGLSNSLFRDAAWNYAMAEIADLRDLLATQSASTAPGQAEIPAQTGIETVPAKTGTSSETKGNGDE